MTGIKIKDRKWLNLTVIFLCWTIFGLFISTQDFFKDVYIGKKIIWYEILMSNLVFCYIWFALTSGVLFFGQHFQFEKGQRLRNFLIHFVLGTFFSVTHLVIYVLFSRLADPFRTEETSRTFLKNFEDLFVSYFHVCLLSYWGVLAINYAVNYYRAYQERTLRASQLETSLARAQLQNLKTQLHPHFLFNTLNTISELMHEDVQAADKMIARLSGLLRINLEASGSQETALRQELSFLQKYIDIQKIRFGELLSVEMKIESETYEALVPNMFLQPLVENAIQYAVAAREEGGRIEITSERINERLHLKIEDNGRSLNPSEKVAFTERVGLKNTRERLEHLYGVNYLFDLSVSANGGLIVNIEIPFVESSKIIKLYEI